MLVLLQYKTLTTQDEFVEVVGVSDDLVFLKNYASGLDGGSPLLWEESVHVVGSASGLLTAASMIDPMGTHYEIRTADVIYGTVAGEFDGNF